MGTSHDSNETVLRELTARCIEKFEDGGPDAVNVFLQDHPDYESRVRSQLNSLLSLGLVNPPSTDSSPPERLGDFELLDLIGRGGMGAVYRARQESLGREVALKLIRPEHLYFPSTRLRFRREVETIARLQHPGIVPVYAVGEENDVPYFAMEYIRGASLEDVVHDLQDTPIDQLSGAVLADTVARRTGESPENARSSWLYQGSWTDCCLRILRSVCDALQHAHDLEILHRDIKPANIMVTPSGRVLLLDFGLALTSPQSTLTQSGVFLGSLNYTSPEQLVGGELSAKTDVYSLGAVLYELLTLTPPLGGSDFEETRKQILDGAIQPIRKRHSTIPWDVETVCLTALAREVKRRLSLHELARDLDNLAGHLPIEARRPGAVLRLRRWIQRHPTWTAIITLSAALLALTSSLAIRNSMLAEGERVAREDAQEARMLVEHELANVEIERARMLGKTRGFTLAEQLLWSEHLKEPWSARTYWALWELYHENPCLWSSVVDGSVIRSVAMSPDGDEFATGTGSGWVYIWDFETGDIVDSFQSLGGEVYALMYDVDGVQLALSTKRGSVEIWDVVDRVPTLQTEAHTSGVFDVDFSPDGLRLASGDRGGIVRIWDSITGDEVGQFETGGVAIDCLRFDPDRDQLLVGDTQGRVLVFDLFKEELTHTIQSGNAITTHLAFHPTKPVLATGNSDHSFRFWDLDTWEELSHRLTHNGTARTLEFSPDGSKMLLAGYWRIDLWDVSDASNPDRILERHGGALEGVWHPDLERFVTVFESGVRVWDTLGRERRPVGDSGFHAMDLRPDGRQFIAGHFDRTVRRWDASTWTSQVITQHQEVPRDISVSADQRHVASGFWDPPYITIVDSSSGETIQTPEGPRSRVNGVDYSPDGKWLAASSGRGYVYVYSTEDYALVHRTERSGEALDVTFSSDSSSFLAPVRRLGLRIWDTDTFAERDPIETGASPWKASIHPSSQLAVTGTWRPEVVVYDLHTGEVAHRLIGNHQLPQHAAFSADGRYVVSGAQSGDIRLWDYKFGQLAVKLGTLDRGSSRVGFVNGDRIIVAGGEETHFSVWDLAHYNRHIAGNAEYWIETYKQLELEGVDWEEVDRWRHSFGPDFDPATLR